MNRRRPRLGGRGAYLPACLVLAWALPWMATLPAAALPSGPTCAGQPATIVGTPGPDDLVGTRGDDVIWAGDGDDVVHAGPGNDLVCAGPGDDQVYGEGGRDTLLGGQGADTLYGASSSDTLRGGPGADYLDSGGGMDLVFGADGHDLLLGGPDDDTLNGGPGDDRHDGGSGIDRCYGAAGTDTAAHCEEVASTEAGQVPEPLIRPGPTQVALTFDDGPSAAYTGQVLDILERYGVPATFFVIGRQATDYPEFLARMVAEGHSVQNHTWSHAWLTRYSDASIIDQLTRANDAIAATTGSVPNCYRPPFGAVNDRVRSVAADLGLRTVMWDVDPWDWKHPGPNAVASHVLRYTRGGDVVLFHDTAGWSTVGALPRIIEGLQAQGLELVPICSVPGLAPRQASEHGLLQVVGAL